MTKLAIVFHSFTGHGRKMAEVIAKAAEEAGAEVRIRPVSQQFPEQLNPAAEENQKALGAYPTATAEDIEWADAVIFGSPTRFSNVSSQFQTFIDGLGGAWAAGKLANKVYAAYTSAQTVHGGQEITLQKIYQMIMHFGGYIVAPGYTDPTKFVDGNPYGVSHTTGGKNTGELSDDTIAALQHMARRIVETAGKLA
ncbi:MAG: NAD(P)H:quinone oxidoreductase [Actinomycetaceae bacterium]|nr:NAD(P)H:quinone oxidoreductase [Actinomycetaceae bacterium]